MSNRSSFRHCVGFFYNLLKTHRTAILLLSLSIRTTNEWFPRFLLILFGNCFQWKGSLVLKHACVVLIIIKLSAYKTLIKHHNLSRGFQAHIKSLKIVVPEF